MYEIEAKVWLENQNEQEKILQKIKKIAKFKKEEKKKDLYFSFPEKKETLFRLRTIGKTKHEVTLKEKKIFAGIEENQEETFYIDNRKTFLSFTKKIGLEVFLKKDKHSLIFQKENLWIELNHVENLGFFLEIEILCQKKTELKNAHKQIVNIFAKLGFSPKSFEKRPYAELLQIYAKK